MGETGNKIYHERMANGNPRIVVLIKNFHCGLIKDEQRLNTLFAVLAIAFCWAYHVGAWRHTVKPIRMKKHQRPAKSIFRYGFDLIRHVLFNPEDKTELLDRVLKLLWQALMGPKYLLYQLYPM
jgi:hypothetical protein